MSQVKKAAETVSKNSTTEFLTYHLGEEIYGVDILQVQEIRGWEDTTHLPNMPNYIKGVINIRGAVVPIMDLRERFSVSEATYDHSTVVIIVRVEISEQIQKIVGLVVDGVSDVEQIDLSELQSAPTFGVEKSVDEQYIQGLATVTQQEKLSMVIILDVNHLVSKGMLKTLEATIEAD